MSASATTATDVAADSAATTAPSGPIPMSFPAILRAPGGVNDRFAHLRVSLERTGAYAPAVPKKNRRDEKEGKRWVRRKENARFVGNPHISRPSASDLSVPVPRTRPTFPTPLPAYLPRTASVPAATPAAREPSSASAGQFSMSLKGMRKELRGRGVMTEVLVREVEAELMDWLDVGVWIDPDADKVAGAGLTSEGTPIGTLGAIREIERTHLQLVWEINDDAFARYVVHCCARYHNIVSFSKDSPVGSSPPKRLTYILRPHVTRPNQNPLFGAPQGLDTPPVTDLGTDLDSVGGTDFGGTDVDIESSIDVESDFVFSEADSDAEAEGALLPPARRAALSAIAESATNSPHLGPVIVVPTESDVEHDADVEHSDLGSETGEDELASSVASLDITPRADRRLHAVRRRSRPWDRQRRAPSSPSGSPARRNPLRRGPRVEPPVAADGKISFYDYLFA